MDRRLDRSPTSHYSDSFEDVEIGVASKKKGGEAASEISRKIVVRKRRKSLLGLLVTLGVLLVVVTLCIGVWNSVEIHGVKNGLSSASIVSTIISVTSRKVVPPVVVTITATSFETEKTSTAATPTSPTLSSSTVHSSTRWPHSSVSGTTLGFLLATTTTTDDDLARISGYMGPREEAGTADSLLRRAGEVGRGEKYSTVCANEEACCNGHDITTTITTALTTKIKSILHTFRTSVASGVSKQNSSTLSLSLESQTWHSHSSTSNVPLLPSSAKDASITSVSAYATSSQTRNQTSTFPPRTTQATASLNMSTLILSTPLSAAGVRLRPPSWDVFQLLRRVLPFNTFDEENGYPIAIITPVSTVTTTAQVGSVQDNTPTPTNLPSSSSNNDAARRGLPHLPHLPDIPILSEALALTTAIPPFPT